MPRGSESRFFRFSQSPLARPSAGEWRVLRACWRLGPEASTSDIVGELSKDVHFEYRHTQSVLQRLVQKGYLEVEKRGPRRNLWTSARPPKDVLLEALRIFVDEVVGLEPENVQMLRETLDDVKRHGPYVAADLASLPRNLRVRLIALVKAFIGRRRHRSALAAALELDPAALEQSPRLSGAISLLSAAGGDTIAAGFKLLDAIEQSLEDGEQTHRREISAIRRQLTALPPA